jgi:hypothetical protein
MPSSGVTVDSTGVNENLVFILLAIFGHYFMDGICPPKAIYT